MESTEGRKQLSLPENAFRELKPGEVYIPVVPEGENPKEITLYSTIVGILMTILWSAATTYIALKYAQGIETAIPIAIIAIGLSIRLKKTMLENVNIMAVGATSGIIAGGSVFVMPAIFILNIEHYSSPFEIFLVPLLGGILGLLFLIPFRRYFVEEQHGKLPFPEATATTEILITGEKGGEQAKILVFAGAVGFMFDFLISYFNLWRENFTTTVIGFMKPVTDNVKAVFGINCTAAIAGLGYIMGVRYASFIVMGSLFACWILVPLVNFFGPDLPRWLLIVPPEVIANGTERAFFDGLNAETLFSDYVRYIGIGGIFAAGIISIIKLFPVMKQAIIKGLGGVISSRKQALDDVQAVGRLNRDIKMPHLFLMLIVLIVVLWGYFSFVPLAEQSEPLTMGIFAVIMTVVMAFLFTSVSAWAIATISITPISGMTLTTLIMTTVLLHELGISGPTGMLGVLLVGGVVCTALSMAGTLVTEFKIGYWLGATPTKIQWSNIWGCVLAAITVTAVMYGIDSTYGFDNPKVIPAAQGNAMAAVVKGILGGEATPWGLYALGAVIVIMVEFIGVSGLAFAMGIYLPIEYNTPLIIGALISYYVKKSHKDGKITHARNERGILFSSGLIAGGAMAGVLTVTCLLVEQQILDGSLLPFAHLASDPNTSWYYTGAGNWIALATFLGLCYYMYYEALKGSKDLEKK